MKNSIHISLRILFILSLGLFITFCNKSSYIEGVGFRDSYNSATISNTKGKITLFYYNNGQCFGKITIYIDGVVSGYISESSYFAPTCGINNTRVCTLEVEQGSHILKLSSSCFVRSSFIEVAKGKCTVMSVN